MLTHASHDSVPSQRHNVATQEATAAPVPPGPQRQLGLLCGASFGASPTANLDNDVVL
jgi:hypothetical protein